MKTNNNNDANNANHQFQGQHPTQKGGEEKELIQPMTMMITPSAPIVNSDFSLTIPTPLKPLTPRELQIAKLVAQELTQKEIANKLNLTTNTVIMYMQKIFAKLGVRGIVGVACYIVSEYHNQVDLPKPEPDEDTIKPLDDCESERI